MLQNGARYLRNGIEDNPRIHAEVHRRVKTAVLQEIDEILWTLLSAAENLMECNLQQQELLDGIDQSIELSCESAAVYSPLSAHSEVDEVRDSRLGLGPIKIIIFHDRRRQSAQCKASRLIDQGLECGIGEAHQT